jgi:hypothetical protein
MQNREDFQNKTSHHDDRSKGETKETKSMLFGVERHNDEAKDYRCYADDHPLIVLSSKREFVFHNVILIKVVQRHFQVAIDRNEGADTRYNCSDPYKGPQHDEEV